MKNTKTWQRVLSMAVCLCMIVGLVPAIASPASAAAAATVQLLQIDASASDGTYTLKNTPTENGKYSVAPYTQYSIQLSVDANTIYMADKGISTDGGVTYTGGITYPATKNNTTFDQIVLGSVTFSGTVSNPSVGYISKRGYFIPTGFGEATVNVVVSVDGVEQAQGSFSVNVVSKGKYKYDFRRVCKGLNSATWSSATFNLWIPPAMITDYKYMTQGDDCEVIPTALWRQQNSGPFDDATTGGTQYPNYISDPWMFSGVSSDVDYSTPPGGLSITTYKLLHKGEFIRFKIKLPEDGVYNISHYGARFAAATANQQIYLAPAEEISAQSPSYTDEKYLLTTENRSGANAWNYTLDLATGRELEEGDYYLTFKKPASETDTYLTMGQVAFTRTGNIPAKLSTVELSYGNGNISLDASSVVTPVISAQLSDGNNADISTATCAYSVTSGTAVSVNETTGALTVNSTGTATVKVSVTLNGVTVSDTVDVTVVDDVLAHSEKFDFDSIRANLSNGTDVKTFSASNWSTNSEHVGPTVVRTMRDYGIQISGGGLRNRITIRLKVDRAGWYDTTLGLNTNIYTPLIRAYLVKNPGAPGTVSEEVLINEEASLGLAYACDLDDNGTSTDVEAFKMRRIKIDEPGEYALTLRVEEIPGNQGQIQLSYFTLDRVAFANATAATVFGSSNVDVAVEQPVGGITVAKGSKTTHVLVPTTTSATYEDFVGASNLTVTSSDTSVATVSIADKTTVSREKTLTITGVEAGTANITVSATRDGVTYTEVIPVQVTHDVANFGTHYAYIRETQDGEKTIYNLALIAGIDDVQATEYAAVGFEYSVGNGVTETYTTQQVYSEITAGTNNVSVTPSQLGADYLFFAEKEIDAAYADTPVKFRAYATLKNGTTVYGGWFTIDSVAKAAASN